MSSNSSPVLYRDVGVQDVVSPTHNGEGIDTVLCNQAQLLRVSPVPLPRVGNLWDTPDSNRTVYQIDYLPNAVNTDDGKGKPGYVAQLLSMDGKPVPPDFSHSSANQDLGILLRGLAFEHSRRVEYRPNGTLLEIERAAILAFLCGERDPYDPFPSRGPIPQEKLTED